MPTVFAARLLVSVRSSRPASESEKNKSHSSATERFLIRLRSFLDKQKGTRFYLTVKQISFECIIQKVSGRLCLYARESRVKTGARPPRCALHFRKSGARGYRKEHLSLDSTALCPRRIQMRTLYTLEIPPETPATFPRTPPSGHRRLFGLERVSRRFQAPGIAREKNEKAHAPGSSALRFAPHRISRGRSRDPAPSY